jgi:NADH-quinone oxidoreductase subunit G
VHDRLRRRVDAAAGFTPPAGAPPAAHAGPGEGVERIGDVPIHGADALVRRAASLQQTPDACGATARLCAVQAAESGVTGAATVKVQQGGNTIRIALEIDERVPQGCLWLPAATRAGAGLGPAFGSVSIARD